MYFFSAGFVTLAVSLAVIASPTTENLSSAAGSIRTIPLTRSVDVVNRDGSANVDFLRRHVNSVSAKVRRNIERRHVGVDLLTEVNDGSLWQGQVSIGTPPTTFRIGYDTGVSEFWIPGRSCGDACAGHDKYDPSRSSTGRDVRKSFNLASADGSNITGQLYSDVLNIGGLHIENQVFGAANNVSKGYWLYAFETDGLLGLGFSEMNSFNASTVFDSLLKQGEIGDPRFSFRMREDGAEIVLGGVNPALYKEPFTYSPVTQKGSWVIEMEALAIDGKKYLSRTQVTVDSGITLIMGNAGAVEALYAHAPGAKDASKTVAPGFYTVPCNNVPTITLTFGGKSFDVSPETFNRGKVPGSERDCIAGITGIPISADAWIVGDMFMQNVYTVFDVGKKRIGFAEYR